MIPDAFKKVVKATLYSGGYYHLLRTAGRIRRPGPRLIILVYHNVTEARNFDENRPHHFQIRPEITVETFQRHMEALKRSFPVQSMEDGLDQLRRGELERDTAAITFDDGYRSFKTLAYPVLQALGLPATMFLATDYVGGRGFYWWDKLNQIVHHLRTDCPDGGALVSVVGEKLSTEWNGCRMQTARLTDFLNRLESEFRYMPKAERSAKIRSLHELLSSEHQAQIQPEGILSWDDIRELTPHAVSWGSHTCSHCGFGDEAQETLQRELVDSKACIEGETSQPVRSFAYPYGGDRESYRKTADLVKHADYGYARTMIGGYNNSETDPYLLNAAVVSARSQSPALIGRDLKLGFVREISG